MLTKLTSKNQVTIPAALLKELPATEYFSVAVADGAIVLRPVRVTPAVDLDLLRDRLHEAGVEPSMVRDAVRWARHKK